MQTPLLWLLGLAIGVAEPEASAELFRAKADEVRTAKEANAKLEAIRWLESKSNE